MVFCYSSSRKLNPHPSSVQSLSHVWLFVTSWTAASLPNVVPILNVTLPNFLSPTLWSIPAHPKSHLLSVLCLVTQWCPVLWTIAHQFLCPWGFSRNQTGVSCIAGKFFNSWATREAPLAVCPTPVHPVPGKALRPFLSKSSDPRDGWPPGLLTSGSISSFSEPDTM